MPELETILDYTIQLNIAAFDSFRAKISKTRSSFKPLWAGDIEANQIRMDFGQIEKSEKTIDLYLAVKREKGSKIYPERLIELLTNDVCTSFKDISRLIYRKYLTA